MARLVCESFCDAKVEYPGERTYDYDPIADALERRPLFVRAALTIVRAYAVAGRPHVEMTPFGGFEGWSRQIRAPLTGSVARPRA
jgi:hypothetical protein